MNINKYFINLIASYLSGAMPEMSCDMVSDEILKLAGINGVSGIIYTELQKFDDKLKDNENYKQLEQQFYVDLMNYNRRNRAKELVSDALKENRIRFGFVKGSILCNFYRDPMLRTMSDIDILIDDGNKGKVHEIMRKLGAVYSHDSSQDDELKYILNKTCIEIHTKLICDEMIANDVDYEKYFVNEINNLNMTDECFGELKPERHVIFMLVHMARHLDYNGCGIRMFMDMHVINEHYKNELDMDYIKKELEKLKLSKFSECVFQLCNKWFDSGFSCDSVLDENEIEKLEKFVLEAGTFGVSGRNTDVMNVRKGYAYSKNGSGNGGSRFLKGAFRLAFPSYKSMRRHSSWFKNKPAVLLPVAYAERIARNSKERGGIFKWIKEIVRGKKEVEYHSDILKLVGLE